MNCSEIAVDNNELGLADQVNVTSLIEIRLVLEPNASMQGAHYIQNFAWACR